MDPDNLLCFLLSDHNSIIGSCAVFNCNLVPLDKKFTFLYAQHYMQQSTICGDEHSRTTLDGRTTVERVSNLNHNYELVSPV